MKASRHFKETTSRTILFRQNVNRSNEAWAKFLKDYKDALIAWDMKNFGDDAHTAEDIVMEIYLGIIVDPVITNLNPDKAFRTTLIQLCKKKHDSVTKPWRNGLKRKLAEWHIISRPSPGDIYLETKLGVGQLVINDLLNREKDGSRSYLTFSPANLRSNGGLSPGNKRCSELGAPTPARVSFAAAREGEERHPLSANGKPQQFLYRHQGIEITVCLNDRRKVSLIDKRRPNRNPCRSPDATDFRIHLVYDAPLNFPTPPHLDDTDRLFRLDQKIDLAPLLPSRGNGGFAIGCRRRQQRIRQMQMRQKRSVVVDNKILKLQAHDRIPTLQRFK